MAEIKLAHKSLLGHSLKGIFWIGSSAWITAILKLIVAGFLARLLSPEDFGRVAAVMLFVEFADIFTAAGIAPALMQLDKLKASHVKTGYAFSLICSLTVGGILALFAGSIAEWLNITEGKHLIQALVLIFPIRSISAISASLTHRYFEFRKVAGLEVVSYVVGYGVFGVGFALMGAGVWALVVAPLCQALINATWNYWIRPKFQGGKVEFAALKDLTRIGGAYTMDRFCLYMSMKVDSIVVSRWLGSSQLGLYERSFVLTNATDMLLTTILYRGAFPVLSRIKSDKKMLGIAFSKSLSLLSLIVIPASFGCIIFGSHIIKIFLGSGWDAAILPFQIFAFGMSFRVGSRIAFILARGAGATGHNALRLGIYAIMIFFGALIGQRYGISGVAVAVVFATIIYFFMAMQMVAKLTGLKMLSIIKNITAAWAFYLAQLGSLILMSYIAKYFGYSSLASIGIGGGASLIVFIGFLLAGEGSFLGKDGPWLYKEISSRLNLRKYIYHL